MGPAFPPPRAQRGTQHEGMTVKYSKFSMVGAQGRTSLLVPGHQVETLSIKLLSLVGDRWARRRWHCRRRNQNLDSEGKRSDFVSFGAFCPVPGGDQGFLLPGVGRSLVLALGPPSHLLLASFLPVPLRSRDALSSLLYEIFNFKQQRLVSGQKKSFIYYICCPFFFFFPSIE